MNAAQNIEFREELQVGRGLLHCSMEIELEQRGKPYIIY
jgi:hypothetical protein